MKTYKFKLYSNHSSRELHRQIECYTSVYNHCIAIHNRYYAIYCKYPSKKQMMRHFTRLKRLAKYAHWNQLGSQAIQDVVQRIDKGYKLFFRNHKHGVKSRPPQFKPRRKYKSFTLKQAGWKWLGAGRVKIGNSIYKYFDSRPIEGRLKTLTIKRDSLGDIYIFVVTDHVDIDCNVTATGKSVGYDFGLKTYLTASDYNDIESPLFFKRSSKAIKRANQNLSRKKRDSHNRHQARLNLARKHRKIANQRDDFHWKLAHELTDTYDELRFETLNLKGMKALWGRKVSDMGFSDFLTKLKYIADKKDKKVKFIDRWYPSSKTCHACSFVNQNLKLRDRTWQCPNCHIQLDRDRNASINIHRVGASTLAEEVISPPSGG